LSGTDEYRKDRLKIISEIVEAPYPIRLLAPKGKEIQVERPFLPTTYRQHDAIGNLCPILEVTLDMLGNATIRGMASLVKRYLNSISLDLAVIVTRPDGQTEGDEPEACLGLWRMSHIDVTQYPTLPDRFETDGCSDELVQAIRANILVKGAHLDSTRPICVASS
jgi:hypothetical protein